MIGLIVRDNKYIQHGIILTIVGLCSALGFYTYTRYSLRKQQKAQLLFTESFEEFRKALQTRQVSQWAETEKVFRAAYQQAQGTTLDPYFLAFEAEAALHSNNKERARELLDASLKLMTPSASLYSLYALKRALIKLDSNNPHQSDEGLEELKQLASDNQNIYRDMALYYLSSFLSFKGDAAGSQAASQELQQIAQASTQASSPWAGL